MQTKFLFLLLIFQFPLILFGQDRVGVVKLHYKPGISIEKNFVDLKSFELGANVFATRGRLTNDVINYYGIESTYKWITLVDERRDGISIRGIYQRLKDPIGFNVQSSVLFARKSTFLLPEVGITLFGVLSLNYGYYFRTDVRQSYDSSLHSISLKLSLNLCYGEYLNIVGKSEKWRFKTAESKD
ncbi:hypothetical protein [Fluviicola taffensis]|uniref:hypothetical protein n=1 Tax=Fluviicola taffensis TaxID=191579 RepID=UPI0031378CF2